MNFAKLAFGTALGTRRVSHDGRREVGCRRSVSLRRDEHGVAYVDAEDELDAWFGLGYCHGQDRAGQLEVTVRLTRGTLAEVLGRDGLPVDRSVRQLGLRRAAQAQLPTLDADVRDQLAAYCAGVNAALVTGTRSHEHALLRCAPTRWEPADVIALGLMMCCFLPSNWDVELARLLILTQDGEAAVDALDPGWRPELPLTSPPGAPAGVARELYVAHDLLALRDFVGHSGGSNAWAVQARKSATGRPLLANDPHLPAAIPNLGYLARVKCPSWAVAGIGIVGIPAFITGHNGVAAWGSTAAQVDNVDLFLEELSPDGEQVREGEHFVPCEAHTELIAVRGEAPVALRVRRTRRGAIVAWQNEPESGIFEPLPLTSGVTGRANAIAFAATWLKARPTRALLGFHKVQSFEQLRECCAASAGCAYSLIYADSASVGWLLATEVPRRTAGYGSLPLPGWEPSVGWQEQVVGSAELPWAKDPHGGFVCCANNKPVADGEATAFLGHDFLDGYRQLRLTEELESRADWSVASTQALQTDVLSLAFREVRPVLLALTARDARAERALELLQAWDGRVTGDSVAAAVYELFMGELCQRLCKAKAPNSYLVASGKGVMKLIPGTCWNARRASFVTRLMTEQPPGYFTSWPDELSSVLSAVMQQLAASFGGAEKAWAWGDIRPLTLRHRFGDKAPLGRVFNFGPLRGYGDATTVNQGGYEFWKPLRHSTVTAHLRAVYDIGRWGESRFVLLGGQSGNPFSPHYTDLVKVWQAGAGVPIHWEDAEVQKHAQHTLKLVPGLGDKPVAAEQL